MGVRSRIVEKEGVEQVDLRKRKGGRTGRYMDLKNIRRKWDLYSSGSDL